MKLLFSKYTYLINELSETAYHLGFYSNLSYHFCVYLGIKGRPIHPSRAVISRAEMLRLYNLAKECHEDITRLYEVIRHN